MFWRKQLDALVARLRARNLPLRLVLWNGTSFDLGDDPRVTLTLPAMSGLRYLLTPSLDNLGTAYVEGAIQVAGSARDIIAVAAAMADGEIKPEGRFGPIRRMVRHNRKMDAEAIAYHYDVSNDFYKQWLDDNMVYSCGYFQHPEDSLETAQVQKIDLILRKIRLQPGQRLLDIGCGWGALILRAAQHWGARCVGITLSQQQYDLARARIAAAGLEDRCEVRLQDYRDVTGHFDRITSVGMFEHVGLKNLRAYFARIHELLADDGVVLNHGITSTDPDSGEVPWGGGSFIERYVFPHGELPHIGLTLREMAAAGLEATDVENLRRHYARTLEHWSYRFETAGDTLRAMVGDRRYRIWRIYLAGCAYGFSHGWVALHQIVATKANSVGAETMPWTRDYIYNDQGAGI